MPTLRQTDPEIASLIDQESVRQTENLRLIASENYASRAVLEAGASPLNNKYSEGYAGKRYYQGQQYIDAVELLAIDRLKKLFGAEHVNVQPYSGSPANLAVHFAFCKPGDTTMGLALPAGGHLTHGWKVSMTGAFFNSVQYGVREADHLLDMDQVWALAKEHRPKMIWCGVSAYPRHVPFDKFAEVAKSVGAILVADIAHVAGLVAGKVHPSPFGFADVVTSTTHKTFRGPRGGMILCNEVHAAAIDKAVFPGLQGGPHNSAIAALAVAAKEATGPQFEAYAAQVVSNAKALCDALMSQGISVVTGGTDTHLVLCDLSAQNVGGKPAAVALEAAGIVCNYNAVPFDKRKPFDPSGIRLGTAALTTRGMKEDDMRRLATWISDVVKNVSDAAVIARTKAQTLELAGQFPAPGIND